MIVKQALIKIPARFTLVIETSVDDNKSATEEINGEERIRQDDTKDKDNDEQDGNELEKKGKLFLFFDYVKRPDVKYLEQRYDEICRS